MLRWFLVLLTAVIGIISVWVFQRYKGAYREAYKEAVQRNERFKSIAALFKDANTDKQLRTATLQTGRLLAQEYYPSSHFQTEEEGPLRLPISFPGQAAIPAEGTCLFIAGRLAATPGRRLTRDLDSALLAINADPGIPGIFGVIEPVICDILGARFSGKAFAIVAVRDKIAFLANKQEVQDSLFAHIEKSGKEVRMKDLRRSQP